MLQILTLSWHYIRAFVLIYLCLLAGNLLSSLFPMMIPGSILGMLVLFFLLIGQILPVHWVKPGCHLMIRYMALLFVPVSVGVMVYYDLLSSQFGPIVISCVVSTLITMLVIAFSTHLLHSRQSPSTKESQ